MEDFHTHMEAVHKQGIWMAESLQLRAMSYEGFWVTVSHMADPKASFLLLFPLCYFINSRTGVAVLWVAALSEWLNLVCKWMLFGERPFWWIGESGLFLQNPPKVQQFASTCETGPGSPSGHAMVTAAVWWVVVFNMASFLYSRTHSWLLSCLPYMCYVLMLVAVGVSRVFILAHFPHQVLAGSVTGFILGVVLSRRVPEGRPLVFFVCTSMGLLVSALALHAGLSALLGIDLSWSIALAQKWCSRPEWIRLDSAPFSSLTRDCGALLGLGLARYWRPGGWALARGPRALCLALASMALYHVNRLQLPAAAAAAGPPGLFYGLFFVKFVIVPQVVMVLVPGLVDLLTDRTKTD